jgi:hypothetical protein
MLLVCQNTRLAVEAETVQLVAVAVKAALQAAGRIWPGIPAAGRPRCRPAGQ